MQLVIERTYFADGTNGILYADDKKLCCTIELPWRDNRQGVSCIPEGTYLLRKRFSEKHKHHLQLVQVPGRDLILVHKANNALLELRGCIAPVLTTTGAGKGYPSAPAFNKLYKLVETCLNDGDSVELIIRRAVAGIVVPINHLQKSNDANNY